MDSALKKCPACNNRVVPMADGTCPACRRRSFSEQGADAHGDLQTEDRNMSGNALVTPLLDLHVTCQCGERISVTSGMAGTDVRCRCGCEIPVPRLGELRGQAGATSASQSTYRMENGPVNQLPWEIRRGQITVLCIIAFLLANSLLVTVLRIQVLGRETLIAANPVRIVLEVALAVFLYKGFRWARYVTGFFLGAGTVILLAGVPTLRETPLWLGAWFMVVILGFGWSAIALVKSQDVRDFMEHQRRKS